MCHRARGIADPELFRFSLGVGFESGQDRHNGGGKKKERFDSHCVSLHTR
jgi:hypothetical protein